MGGGDLSRGDSGQKKGEGNEEDSECGREAVLVDHGWPFEDKEGCFFTR